MAPPPPELDVLVAEPFAESSEGSAQKPMPHLNTKLPIPRYLQETYWWAYLHPRGVRFFDRLWMVNLILFGHFNRLRDAALARLGERVDERLLQVAAVYGDITPNTYLGRLIGSICALAGVLKELGAAYREVIGPVYPAMAVVQVVSLMEPDALIEIETTAVRP